jgi:sec-independent protein translocase protein TatB
MPSFQDSAILVFLALLLFGPKKLPELARQLGKLMGEFRRASNEFRMQMEDELRIADQEDQRKKVAAMEAAAPVAPALTGSADYSIQPPATPEYGEDHPHMPPPATEPPASEPSTFEPSASAEPLASAPSQSAAAPLPIASSGDLNLMPPPTGRPVNNSALTPVLDSIPHIPDPEPASAIHSVPSEAPQHG